MNVIDQQELPFFREQMLRDFQGQQVNDYKSYRQLRFNAMRKETQDITITTEEGDKVTISALDTFKADYMAFDYSEQLNGQTGSLEAEKLNASSKHAFKMTVEGDLNAEEQEDIEKVLSRLDDIMDDLVSGDIEGIMNEVPGLIDDTETISGLNAVLQFHQRVSMSQRTMTQTTGEQLPPPGKALFDSNFIATITDKLMDIINQSDLDVEKLKGPVEGYFSQLLDKLGMEKGENNPLTQMVNQLNTELLDRLTA